MAGNESEKELLARKAADTVDFQGLVSPVQEAKTRLGVVNAKRLQASQIPGADRTAMFDFRNETVPDTPFRYCGARLMRFHKPR